MASPSPERARRMMLNSLSPEARQIYACLELGTMGFQQELAVTMANGAKVLLTNAHICKSTGLSKQNVRRGLAELEAAGLGERRGMEGGPLYKGRVEIYSWAEPRAPKNQNGSQRATTIPEWFPKSWEPLKPLIRRLKLSLLPDLGDARDSLFAEGDQLARDFQKAEKVVVAFLKGVSAPKRLYKEERTERTERTSSSGGRAVPVESEPARPPNDPPPSKPETPLWHPKLWVFLKTLPIYTVLDEPMFQRIAAALREDIFEQFQAVAKEASGIRKWSGYLAIAKQVAARGVVKAAAAGAGQEESFLERRAREIDAARKGKRNG